MKIGVMSDIHSNVVAFKAAAEKLLSEGCEEFLLLGDYVSDTSYTRETMDYLYDFMSNHVCHVLRGNREEYMLNQRQNLRESNTDKLWVNNSASGNLLYSYEQLKEKDLDFFESLPITFKYEREGFPTITCCHGSPVNTRELLQFYGDNSREWLDKIDTEYMVCAHTHHPGELEYNGKHYFNCGCIGVAIDDAGFAECLMLETIEKDGKTEWQPTFLKVPYDNEQVVKDIYKSGLYDRAPWFMNCNVHILLTGIDKASAMVIRAGELADAAFGAGKWPHVEEKYFEQASHELGIPDYPVLK